jgi:hypothetical protein
MLHCSLHKQAQIAKIKHESLGKQMTVKTNQNWTK